MKVTYKLVGIHGDYNFTKDHDDVEFMTLTNFQDDIREIGFNESFNDVMFICRHKTLKDNTIKINDESCIVFIFSKIIEIKLNLKEAFETVVDKDVESPEDKTIDKSLTFKPVQQSVFNFNGLAPVVKMKQQMSETVAALGEVKLDEPVVNNVEKIKEAKTIEHNSDVIKTLADPDFMNLLKIYQTKPELLLFAFNYLSSGSIVDKIDLEDIKSEIDDKYNSVHQQVKELMGTFNISVEDELVYKLINRFEGNISLIFRYLYQKNVSN